ncbi:MAG: inosine/xanthosine triphosphatase [Promethearchaeota archaeon]|nr:MAG: inosine/xanthosine triphosphatase [Candidatus Lokiarchaeota archaeon]
MGQIKICVGSLNPTKINAVKIGFSNYYENCELYKIKADSKVPNQPIGMEFILTGAKNRAESALNYLINKDLTDNEIFGVGIEAGLVHIPLAKSKYMDFQFCVIMDENREISLGSGIAFEYPKRLIDEIISNKEKEIGEVMGKLAHNMNLKNEAGAISFLSKGIISRTEILSQAVICALLPRINQELYKL